MMKYMFALLIASLSLANAYDRRYEQYYRDDRLAQSFMDLNEEKSVEIPEKRGNGCKYPGESCHGDYSYGCRNIKEHCQFQSCEMRGTCWRQCWAGSKSWCNLRDVDFKYDAMVCKDDAMCLREMRRRFKTAPDVCKPNLAFSASYTCYTDSNP